VLLLCTDWVVEFYQNSKGREQVADFIDSLSIGAQAKILRLIDLLARYGVLLKEPYTKQIKGKLRELRIVDKTGNVRILYFTYTGKICFAPRLCQEDRKDSCCRD
jgi:phage-related protein